MSEIQVRPITSDDFLRVAALLAELGRPVLTPETSDAVQAVYERHNANPQTASLVAEVNGQIVGFLSLVFREHLNFIHPQGWIPDLIVTESARGQGAARALLEQAFTQAKQHGCDWVRLESGYTRTVAHQAYEAVGMTNGGYYFTKTADRMTTRCSALLAALLLLIVLVPARAQEALAPALDKMLDATGLKGGITGAIVCRVDTGQVLYAHDADTRLIPASNRKLFTSAAALEVLGDDFQIHTALRGGRPAGRGGDNSRQPVPARRRRRAAVAGRSGCAGADAGPVRRQADRGQCRRRRRSVHRRALRLRLGVGRLLRRGVPADLRPGSE